VSKMIWLGEIFLLPLAWAAVVLGSLQSKLLFSGPDHLVCGPWGCGPETSALVAIHTAWLAIIGPPLVYLPLRLKLQSASIRRLSVGLFAVGLAGVLGIVAWQWLVWLPQAGPGSKNYIWQRCGFVVVTAIDWPLIQLLVLSPSLWIIAAIRKLHTSNQINFGVNQGES
jgi:hypothetical protein